MQEILAINLQSMRQDMQKLDQISSNMANAITPGYQRGTLSRLPISISSGNFSAMVESGMVANGAASRAAGSAQGVHLQMDTKPGVLKATGQSLDIAIAGPGYFEVATPSGPAYTRQGNFRLDERGRIVNSSGFPLIGKGGEIFLKSERPVIDEQGNIFDKNEADRLPETSTVLDKIKLIESEDSKTFHRLGDGLITFDGGVRELAESDRKLKQGFLENSNVNTMQEMVQLMETMRHFEAMQKITLAYDEMTGQAIKKLGELS
ncbi:flagellar hook-basal body protein [Acidovorax sp. 1608163]|uniref:flagellar hook-basal body protein n=1 Tax=Acidovorax sp. 1608163 TaxID=2478662 RepID=UPI000EF714FE|nr:flagellar hook-basal body protein [Acidovorax sp. 1608163]